MLAIIFGLIARRQIKERDETGDGMAIAGIVLGILGVVGTVVMIIIFAAVVDDLEEYEDFQMIRLAALFAGQKVSSAAGAAKDRLAASL